MSPRATGEAMSAGAAERALSLPPIGNPFWSERAPGGACAAADEGRLTYLEVMDVYEKVQGLWR